MNKNVLKTMLVAIGLAAGTIGTWGQEQSILYSQNFDDLTDVPTDWTQASGILTLEDDGSGNKFLKESTSGSGSRGAWYIGNAIKNSVAEYDNWTIEFDCCIAEGTNTGNYSQGVWILGNNLNSEWGAPKQPLAGLCKGSKAQNYTIYIGGATTSEVVSLKSNTYYHYIFNYDKSLKELTLTIKSEDQATDIYEDKFTYDYSTNEIGDLSSIYIQAGRNSTGSVSSTNGFTCIDNIILSTESNKEIVGAPTASITGVNGVSRIVSITAQSPTHKLFYYLNDDNKNTKEYKEPIEIKETSTLHYYATSATSDVQSEIQTLEVNCGEIKLNAPVYSITNLSNGYVKEYTITIDNSDILLTPEATLSYVFTPENGTTSDPLTIENNGIIKSDKKGTYIVTATAEGYTSNSITIDNNVAYTLTNEFDFAAMTDEDFSNQDLWTKGTDTEARWGWNDSNPATKYELNNPEENAETAIEGIKLFTDRIPTFYIGYGLMVPYGNSNYSNISLTSAEEGQYAIYTRLNNYGRATLTDVQQATEEYALYRFSDMLKDIKVYSPIVAQQVSITDAGVATFTPSVALDFSNAKNIAAYKASVSGTTVNLTKVQTVAAGEGVLVRSLDGQATTEDIPVAAVVVSKSEDNMFVGTLTDIESLPTNGDGYTNYILNNGSKGLGFYRAYNQTVAAGKAYLAVPATSAAKISFFSLDGGTVGIEGIESNEEAKEDVYYTISGQRVAAPTKGLYIKNGKKVIVK